MNFISIIIITYNRPDETLALLQNLKEQKDLNSCVKEILLLNNASTVQYDNVIDFILNNKNLSIEYINSTENMGVAKGRNFLIEKAQNPYLLVLDDDVVFADDGAISIINTMFDKQQYVVNNTGIITLNIYYFDTKARQKNALPHKRYEIYKDKKWFLTYYFTGAAHLMKKELFDKTGFYPEDFFYGMEEYDLSYRAINSGYTLAYDNSVKVWHKESPIGRITNKEKMAMMWFNKSKVAWKYLPKKYFYSTVLMWSLEYLAKTKFDIRGYFKTWRKVCSLRKLVLRQAISKKALKYLKSVQARLWY